MLYELCPACGGTGLLKAKAANLPRKCPACVSRAVIATGLSAGQAERAVRAELILRGLVSMWRRDVLHAGAMLDKLADSGDWKGG